MLNWFRKKAPGLPVPELEVLPHGKKLALINLHDYPRDRYSAYWEIGVSNTAPFRWLARLISFDTHVELEVTAGVAESEDDARRKSQQWVLDHIEAYRRAEVMP